MLKMIGRYGRLILTVVLLLFATFNLLHLGAEVAFLHKQPILAAELYSWDYRYPFNAGMLYLEIGKYEVAEAYYLQTVKLFPTFIEGKNNLAATWAMMGRKTEAERLLRDILAVDPGYESARENLERLGLERNPGNRVADIL